MKYILLLLMFLFVNIGLSQDYFVHNEGQIELNTIKIRIDTNSIFEGILVERDLISVSDTISFEMTNYNSIVLLGDFESENGAIVLNYDKNNFFFIPFDPDTPFFSLNHMNSSSNYENGLLHVGHSSRVIGDTDIIFWCRCDGTGDQPGGCLSTIRPDGFVDCIDDANECGATGKYCLGTATVASWSINGGGVLIKVSAEKSSLLHSINSN